MDILLISENQQLHSKFKRVIQGHNHWKFFYCHKFDEITALQTKTPQLLFLDDANATLDATIAKFLLSHQPVLQLYAVTNSIDARKIKNYLSCGFATCISIEIPDNELLLKLIVAESNLPFKRELHELRENYTQLKNVQTQLVQAEKLAGIGRLAAGIAHEINNPLGFVSGNIEVLGKYIERYEAILDMVKNTDVLTDEACINTCREIAAFWKDKKVTRIRNDMRSLFEDTKEGLDRISNIVTGLKNFSRINQQNEKGLFNLNEGIKTTLIVARNELKYHCEIDFTAGDIPAIYVNGGQINQVILNMLINAAHAVQAKFPNDKGQITIRTYEENETICCMIQDNGCGMDETVIEHIFEPFFTTKDVGVGTGLGLGIAYDIIYNRHCGKIGVESKPGFGTIFTIYLPKTTEPEPSDDEINKK